MDRLENTSASGEQIIFLENMADVAVFFFWKIPAVMLAIAFSYN